MIIPTDVLEKVKNSYLKGWDKIEKPLFLLFLKPKLTDSVWIRDALLEVSKKYKVLFISPQRIAEAAPRIARTEIKTAHSEAEIGELIHKIASLFPPRHNSRSGYELSLTAKFLSFCYPESIPPFDKYAYTALYFSEVGRSYGLKWDKHPRSGAEIEMWLSSFRDFYNQHLSLCKQTRGEIIKSVIPIKDRALAERAITPLKVCDTILWVWGGGSGSA